VSAAYKLTSPPVGESGCYVEYGAVAGAVKPQAGELTPKKMSPDGSPGGEESYRLLKGELGNSPLKWVTPL
jgi:hypothetical protein